MRKRIVTKIFILCFIAFASITGIAQDMHFSQFYHSPLLTNPANTGVFSGRYRISTNYKNQWQSVTNPYKTVFAGIDFSTPSKKLGIGFSVFNDKAGKSRMGITQGNLYLSYNLRINGSNRFITGLQYGVGQKSMRINDLMWDSQFNGVAYDPTVASGEAQYSESYTYMDVSAGMMWNYTASHSASRFKNSVGVAVFHANQPQQSFDGNEKLYYKIVAHINNQFKLSESPIYILPQVLYSMQGPYKEINAGALVKFVIGNEQGDLIRSNRIDKRYSSPAAYIGGQFRYKDAFIAMAAFEFKKGLLLSVSYDVNVSKLHVASGLKGGTEFALIYRGFFAR